MENVQTDNMFELHPPGTIVELITTDEATGEQHSDAFRVGSDGLWRNKYGQVPAGQMAAPPEPVVARGWHCAGCRCEETPAARGRMKHGDVINPEGETDE